MVDVSSSSFSASGRGWSDRGLLIAGVSVLAILGLVTGLLLAKSKGYLEDTVKVEAQLTNVGDGLPERADVKFRGMLVGAVTSVTPAEDGKPNVVHIDLKSEHASGIPSTVTARVVPSNVFAVSSVQLVDNGDSAALRNGAVISEDTKLPTVLFQTTTNKLREVLAATERQRGDPPIGIIGVLGQATQGRGDKLLTSGARLQRILTEFNAMVTASPNDPSTIAALEKMTEALSTTSPRLLDNLENALVPLRTIAQKESDVRGLLSAGLHTTGTASTAIDNHIDQMIGIGTHLTPVVGVLAQNSDKFEPIASRIKVLSDSIFANGWDPGRQVLGLNLILSFTPAWTYVRDDCPRYGELAGPSCTTAPETRQWIDIPEVLQPGSYKPPPDIAPPAGTIFPPTAADIMLHGGGPNPQEVDRSANPVLPPFGPPPNPAPAGVAPASFGGNVGPVGSAVERDQLGKALGGNPNTAQQLLLGPVARGMTISVSQDNAEGDSAQANPVGAQAGRGGTR
ncbi:MCE family protein [Mycobacterium sp. CBMA271]|nr:MCE family protein [Mycobacteroides sp. CBMA 271]